MTKEQVAMEIVRLLDEKKGADIVCYDISRESSLADYFIICTGNSDTHINALADFVIVEMKNHGERNIIKDGYKVSRWVCLDFGNVLVNIMGERERQYYSLEAIWGDCPKLDLADVVSPEH